MSDNLLFSIDAKGIATITLNRPEVHNAFDDALIHSMLHILQQLNKNAAVKVVLLTAEGKNFSAGADLNWMRRMASFTFEENVKDALALSELMQSLKSLKYPTIAKVQGAVVGGGVGLVSCCDIAIASEQATFCLSEVKVGLIPAVISPYVISAIGERAARRYFLTAEKFSADAAHQLGLATQVVAESALEEAINNMLGLLLQNSPQALSAAKVLINRVSAEIYTEEQRQLNAEAIAAIRASTEGQEGVLAFLEKRKPFWCE